jgi:alkylated DNA repair dioxygenase AlkB
MIKLRENYISPSDADCYMAALREGIPWRQDTLKLFGKEHRIPRLHQWYADEGLSYAWSGITMQPQAWIELLLELREALFDRTKLWFNSVLVNLYRDGNDSMGWHSDDEPELGEQPTIASISLGATRDFRLRRRNGEGSTRTLSLTSGSLLLMSGNSQHNWLHSLPKRKTVVEPRINLTFRRILK